MQLGIFAYTFVRPTVEEVFDSIKACGLEHTEFSFTAIRMQDVPDQIDEAVAQRVRTAAAERGITMDSVGGYTNIVHPDPKKRQAEMISEFSWLRIIRSTRKSPWAFSGISASRPISRKTAALPWKPGERIPTT